MKVSVITVCLNASGTIEATLRSVLQQSCGDIEYIVMDGCSTDGTLDILGRYPDIDRVCSEKDAGIFDAMNRALEQATGDLIYFLNADDIFHDQDTVAHAVETFAGRPDLDLLFGHLCFVNLPVELASSRNRTDFHFSDKRDLFRHPIPQQCCFYRRSALHKNGTFNTKYRMCADYEWLLRAMDNRLNIGFTDQVFCDFNYQGLSYQRNLSRRIEKNRIILANAGIRDLLPYVTAGIRNLVIGKRC